MKKLAIMGVAVLLVVALTVPAFALENVFGGYWRTRFFTQQDFTGQEDTPNPGNKDYSAVDTRTRLYYTAVINDDLKFVNKFEMDAVWGVGGTSYGDVGADGLAVEVKNSYADFNVAPMLSGKVGVQGFTLARGFIADDDFSGVVASFKTDMVTIPLVWLKVYEGGMGNEVNQDDFDYYGTAPIFKPNENMSIQPYVLWATSDDYKFGGDADNNGIQDIGDADIIYAGLDLNLTMDVASLWFTGIYQGGEVKVDSGYPNKAVDVSAYLLAAGGSANLGPADVHGQAFYATGQDPKSEDMEAFFIPAGQSYYWAEIMGYGIFDQQVSANAPADQISNILAANVGTTFKPMEDLSISLDVWYAKLAEEDANKEDELGTEVDLTITYELVEGLKLDVVGAYLFAGDATYYSKNTDDDANPVEIGSRLSLSF